MFRLCWKSCLLGDGISSLDFMKWVAVSHRSGAANFRERCA